ncbi:DUF742 domain-containing protein [Amycolatopsis pithecellobii]|uniref:DUF742 domain-containing protein n=1 Tax=Amycolatopsis pithecellobii TaxID=664692 RepID=A0A6N7ZD92_9PSEU|nr:DUF742 domain-containing protein [Amycolatopsis pithecellobii]MTD59675.1 DUF742 domain-containing protein [Amycolatopsis pithecellobii]
MTAEEETWFDADAGPLARPYTVTGGRTRTDAVGLDLLTLVVAVTTILEAAMLPQEYARVVRLCQQPLSVAEVAAYLELPLPVVKVLLADLIAQNHVIFRSATPMAAAPDERILQAVLDGIRRL